MDLEHLVLWTTRILCVVLIVAAVIDVWKLKVPNWITFPLIIAGWIFWTSVHGWSGLGFTLFGTAVGLSLLLVPYAIGGMGAGDVKLLAGVGAWVGAATVFWAFCLSAMVGGLMAAAMMLYRRYFKGQSVDHFKHILFEFVYLRNISAISEAATLRKSSMMLLPYGLPLTVGTIGYFIWMGMV